MTVFELTDWIQLSNEDRRSLVKQGKKLGAKIKDLISIVIYSTFRKLVRTIEDTPTKRPLEKSVAGRSRVEYKLD